MIDVPGGVTAPAGFTAGATACGIKYRDRPDLALIVSEVMGTCAGVFTTNRVTSAPVKLCRQRIADGRARAIIANSGNANACTGEAGMAAAERMAAEAACMIGCDPSEVLVSSTGVIGRQMPVDRIAGCIPALMSSCSQDGSEAAARAIMTTDTVPKETAVECLLDGVPVRIGAIAKGAGMISPDMATLLCFVTTDAAIESPALQAALHTAVGRSFNRITVDGDMSPNDTLLVLANGRAGNMPITKPEGTTFETFSAALAEVCLRMARSIVRDAEGGTKFVTITVTGAPDENAAKRAGLAVANSPLVKTALFGADPNWGRIICATGASGVPFDEDAVTVAMNGVMLYADGGPLQMDEPSMRASLAGTDIALDIDLGMGDVSTIVYTSDLTYEYIKINAEYTT